MSEPRLSLQWIKTSYFIHCSSWLLRMRCSQISVPASSWPTRWGTRLWALAFRIWRSSVTSWPLPPSWKLCSLLLSVTWRTVVFNWRGFVTAGQPPSDRVITKAQRALAKRSLEVIDLWQIRSIATQRTPASCARDFEASGAPVQQSWFAYLAHADEVVFLVTCHGRIFEGRTSTDCPWECNHGLHKSLLTSFSATCAELKLWLWESLRSRGSLSWRTWTVQSEQSGLIVLPILLKLWVALWQLCLWSAIHIGQFLCHRLHLWHLQLLPLVQPRMPHLAGAMRVVELHADALRDGERLCAEYQRGRCNRQRDIGVLYGPSLRKPQTYWDPEIPLRFHSPRVARVRGSPYRFCARPLQSIHMKRVIVASDASQDSPRQGRAGLLVSSHDFARLGAVIAIDSSVFQLWDDTSTNIAQLELLAVVQALITFSDLFRNAHVVWFVDNVAALMALIKGRSDHEELDHMAQIAHSLLFHLQCFVFFEWAPSASNWSDGISRDGFADPWLRRHQFATHLSSIPVFYGLCLFQSSFMSCPSSSTLGS